MSKCTKKGLGLLVLPPNIILRNPIADAISTHLLHQPLPALSTRDAWSLSGPASPEVAQLCALCGVFSCAISLAYGMSMYHGFDEWIYLSVPGRLAVVLLALVTWVLNRHAMSPLLFTIVVWDGHRRIGHGMDSRHLERAQGLESWLAHLERVTSLVLREVGRAEKKIVCFAEAKKG